VQIHLKYFQKYPNAGDRFSLEIARRYFGPEITPCDHQTLTQPNLILLGSILQWADAMTHVCGAGLLTAETKLDAAPSAIHCVRGPLTARALEGQGIPCPAIFGDPGVLAPFIFPQTQSPDTRIGVIPHYVDKASPWIESCRARQCAIIDVFSPPGDFFHALQRCEIILSSSLHGLIFAHAYDKPALWIELSDRVIGDGFKFFDYYSSMNMAPHQITRLRVSEDTDPVEIAKFATRGSHASLIASLETAIGRAKRELEQSR
jgi:pyruvyltransferase